MKKTYDINITVEGLDTYNNLRRWIKLNEVICTTTELKLLDTYQLEFEDLTYKQYVFIRRLAKIL